MEIVSDYIEKQILGCFIKDNSLLQETRIRVDHFDEKNTHHRSIYKTMKKLKQDGKQVDHISLMSELYEMLTDLGGPDYIMSIQTKGDPNNFETYETTMIEHYQDRETKKLLQQYLSNDESDRQTLMSKMQELEEETVTDETDVMDLLAEMLDEPYQEENQDLTGIPSGLEALDSKTGGFQPKTSVIIGARPSMGKTALMLRFMMGAIKSGNVPVVFSLEMSKESLLRRLVAAAGSINLFLARYPSRLTEKQKETWYKVVGKLSSLDFEISDEPLQTVNQMRGKLRKVKRQYPDKNMIVLIDYLTLISNPGSFSSDHAKVSDISGKLKAMAKEYACPVLTLAQLSRGVEQRQDKHPLMSDLRESGSIEQDADIILLLYRDSYYNPDTEKQNILEINIAKHRDGPTGQVEIHYNKATGEMKDL